MISVNSIFDIQCSALCYYLNGVNRCNGNLYLLPLPTTNIELYNADIQLIDIISFCIIDIILPLLILIQKNIILTFMYIGAIFTFICYFNIIFYYILLKFKTIIIYKLLQILQITIFPRMYYL